MNAPQDLSSFLDSLKLDTPPSGLSSALEALWWDGKGEWSTGHDLLKEAGPPDECHVHAYLHRKEGEDWNARYWYGRAGEKFYKGSLEQEWQDLVQRYLALS